MSLPRKIGRIKSSVRRRSLSDLQFFKMEFRCCSEIINASLQPVRIPRLIFMFQSFNGVPMRSILDLIDCSIGFKITQLLDVLNSLFA